MVGAVGCCPPVQGSLLACVWIFIHHVRRVALLVVLVWLVLGVLHKVHLCIGVHRRFFFWGTIITQSLVCTWLFEGSSSVSVSFCVLGPLSRRIRSSLVIRWHPIGQILLRHMMTLKIGLRYVLGRTVCVTGVLTAAA